MIEEEVYKNIYFFRGRVEVLDSQIKDLEKSGRLWTLSQEGVKEEMMKKYKCHKVVEAMKIESLQVEVYGHYAFLWGEDKECVKVRGEYIDRHNPKVGGYYVRYEDGYESYSPAEAFENGYTEIADGVGSMETL